MPPPASSPRKPCLSDGHSRRRSFLKATAAALLGLILAGAPLLAATGQPAPRPGLRFGIITDVHYSEALPAKGKFYRESLRKMREAVDRFRAEKVSFVVELGDFKDRVAGEPEAKTLTYLTMIEREFRRFGGPTYHVLGNHDMDALSKTQVLGKLTNTGIPAGKSYYAFSTGGVRFVVLDSTFTKDGQDYDHDNFDWRDSNIPSSEIAWLREELNKSKEPVIVFVHHRLDGDGDMQIANRAEIRALLESSGKVLAVFQGHEHKGAYTKINDIHYYTLRAVVDSSGLEANSFAIVEVHPNRDVTVVGYRRAVSIEMPYTPPPDYS